MVLVFEILRRYVASAIALASTVLLFLVPGELFLQLGLAESPAQLSRGQIDLLTSDGDRLADQGDFLGALKKYTRAYQGVVANIRGQHFVREVLPNILNREQLGQEMLAMISSEYTADELRLMDGSLKALGLVPSQLNVPDLITKMLTEEVAGFYDPDSKRMVLIVEEEAPNPGLFSRLFGAGSTFNKDEQKTTLAHELTHALQDQLYDLNSMEAKIEHDDDMVMAFQALVEGDATLLMFVEASDNDAQDFDPAALRASFSVMSWLAPFAGGESLRKAPPIFRDGLMFPYLQGMLFNVHLAAQGGWEQVHLAYQSPPCSTEQILHPNKYSDTEAIDAPIQVNVPDLATAINDSNWQYLGKNCLGEFQTAILLKRVRLGSKAAAGWGGDTYVVFQDPESKALGLVWVSIWDTDRDAIEFRDAFIEYRNWNHGGSPLPDELTSGTSPNGVDQVFDSTSSKRVVQLHNNQVWIVEGFDFNVTNRILAALPNTTFEEKKIDTLR
ncbi:MAG: hypothetical protein KDB03_25095 [Planctomycetales bacterium]|nr:hypothetical protein [Planctomycetales bacterium]